MLRVSNVKIPVQNDNEDTRLEAIYHKLKKKCLIKKVIIQKKSIDARHKEQINYVYVFDIEVDNEDKYLAKDISKTPSEKYIPPKMGEEKLEDNIVIVGAGPAGLMAAYLLCENGYKPIIIERGSQVEKRVEEVQKFWDTEVLNPECNVQFGEGGAGTFSDGKLNTLVKDKQFIGKKVFEIFVDCGAPKEIMYEQKPHIGTDILRKVIVNLRNKIIAMGGNFLFDTKLTNFHIQNNKLVSIEVNNNQTIACQNLILAIGHSARDTFRLLLNNGLTMQAKPFAVGIRIMHNQQMINESQYGKLAKYLPNASYKLTYTTKGNRGVYTFCMCPGGYVVNASSENKRLAINGMSNYKRDSENANSAIIVTVSPNDFGHNPLDGVNFQESLEEKAFELGKGKIPLQLWSDFLNNQPSVKLSDVTPEIKGQYILSNLNTILPDFINKSIKEAIPYFDTKIKGFANPSTILAAIESRSSSPVRIIRDGNFEANIKGIYPCGEGAGYAGGITTAAIDGIKVAEAIIKKYHI